MMLIPRLANMMYDQALDKLKRAESWEKQVSTPAWPHHYHWGAQILGREMAKEGAEDITGMISATQIPGTAAVMI